MSQPIDLSDTSNKPKGFIEFVKDWRTDQFRKGKPSGLSDFIRWFSNPAEYEARENTSVSKWVVRNQLARQSA